ncbi:hypothetical protein [Roseateles sp. L2-2]|uniref:hypothetical protein n=1 Tax=Roseateles sp. L2-2 TaxID=3422597 RepID=UPI003D35F5DF
MITEIPTQSRNAARVVGTVLCIILAAAASALILTGPVWSVDDLVLPAARPPTPAPSTTVTSAAEPKTGSDSH